MNRFLTESFFDCYSRCDWHAVSDQIAHADRDDVERALSRAPHTTLEDMYALLSPAALPYLESMARLSQEITKRRFGNTIQLFVPLYVSNECQNICTYCGFSYNNKLNRLTLNAEQLRSEAAAIRSLGFDHVLVVSGEAARTVGVPYFLEVLSLLREEFSQVSLEVQPLLQEEYEQLASEGLHAVYVYQETYDAEKYSEVHPKGKKANFRYRLETPDRLGLAEVRKIGIGALLGLSDWRTDSWFTALHLHYLRRRYWKSRYSISFPRLRRAEGYSGGAPEMGEAELLQLITAFRLFDENVELSLSTRESQHFRDHALALGVTAMSAGSKTEPGGYSLKRGALEQFSIDDNRSPAAVAEAIRRAGYEPVWKDWDPILQGYDATRRFERSTSV